MNELFIYEDFVSFEFQRKESEPVDTVSLLRSTTVESGFTPGVTSRFSESLEYELYVQQHWMNLQALTILSKPPNKTMKYPISDEWSDRLWALRQLNNDQQPASKKFGLRKLFDLPSSHTSKKMSPSSRQCICRQVIVFLVLYVLILMIQVPILAGRRRWSRLSGKGMSSGTRGATNAPSSAAIDPLSTPTTPMTTNTE